MAKWGDSFTDMMRYYQDHIGYKSHTKNMKDGIRVGSKSFPEFIAKRVLKDNLGYIPGTELYDGITDCKSYIKACVPTEPHELLVYLHELGHCKSKQYPRESSGMRSFTCRNTLQNEFNAWKWALRYYRRLGYSLCEKSKKLIKETYGTYIKNASEIDGAIFAEYMYHLSGVDCSYKKPVIKYNYDFSNIEKHFTIDECWYTYELPKTPKPIPQKPRNWKPWHDLKNNQFKKQWRNSK